MSDALFHGSEESMADVNGPSSLALSLRLGSTGDPRGLFVRHGSQTAAVPQIRTGRPPGTKPAQACISRLWGWAVQQETGVRDAAHVQGRGAYLLLQQPCGFWHSPSPRMRSFFKAKLGTGSTTGEAWRHETVGRHPGQRDRAAWGATRTRPHGPGCNPPERSGC